MTFTEENVCLRTLSEFVDWVFGKFEASKTFCTLIQIKIVKTRENRGIWMHDQMLFFCCFVKSRLWRPIINAFVYPQMAIHLVNTLFAVISNFSFVFPRNNPSEKKKERQLRYFDPLLQKSFWTYNYIQTDLKKCIKHMVTEM